MDVNQGFRAGGLDRAFLPCYCPLMGSSALTEEEIGRIEEIRKRRGMSSVRDRAALDAAAKELGAVSFGYRLDDDADRAYLIKRGEKRLFAAARAELRRTYGDIPQLDDIAEDAVQEAVLNAGFNDKKEYEDAGHALNALANYCRNAALQLGGKAIARGAVSIDTEEGAYAADMAASEGEGESFTQKGKGRKRRSDTGKTHKTQPDPDSWGEGDRRAFLKGVGKPLPTGLPAPEEQFPEEQLPKDSDEIIDWDSLLS